MTDQNTKILVVDDEAAIGLVLQAGLELNGFEVMYEERSRNAIKSCLEFQPDLILLDVEMPFKDGGEVAADLESHPLLKHIPVMFLTSLVSKEEAGQNASGRTFLSKPIPLAELVARIRAVLQARIAP